MHHHQFLEKVKSHNELRHQKKVSLSAVTSERDTLKKHKDGQAIYTHDSNILHFLLNSRKTKISERVAKSPLLLLIRVIKYKG